MKIEQIYTGCLAQGAYYIESEGEVAIIDPLREVEPYLKKAEKEGQKIKYVFETHFHADFVSGHLDLSKKSGAPIIYGPNAVTGFDSIIATDGQTLKLGAVTIKVLHTPGHTMESTSYLLIDENGKETALFSGDTLFIGDVGRPDLAQKSDLTIEDLAGHLYDSLRNKIMVLPDDVIVYPAHGAGSACGKNMSKETTDTLGNQKSVNYALRANMTKAEFIKEVTDGLAPPPQYFPENVKMNKEGYESIDTVMNRGAQALSPAAFEAAANETGAVVLDTRDAADFAAGFVPNSINIGLNGQFAPWVGALIPDLRHEILLITEPGKEEETVIRLARVGYDNTIGYLKDGIPAWKASGAEVDSIESIDAAELAKRMEGDINVIDVRRPGEYEAEHVEGVPSFPLDFINDNMAELDRDKKYTIHCAGGYRSMMAASILKARGFEVVDVKGGFGAINNSGLFKTTAYVCPSTLK
ncbi:MBL fold metallo-hydrolase [Arcticibacterium luteifluviistationis]|uniref:MBL fold metallo-hydrolase n=1 Tax=Arcticibacterium luteifluviistationis TaxID=1784714 RepID=A0A2Z4G7T4_9BACT|nr:rhodanese-like domain-containing protein [Arcticibacterium luteifluviistationis]AWV97234.1 MBL fold metallo-hydrolase [Arcticibacterium luteifluviistationis]